MKIKRTVNVKDENGCTITFDIEIELTADEIFNTYLEQEWLFDVQNIENNMEYHLSEEEYEILKENRDFIESAAQELRHNQDKHDMDYEYALEEAFKSIKEKYC